MNITGMRQFRSSKMIALVVAIAVFQLYPLDICYGYGDQPDVDDILQAILSVVPATPPDSETWMATLPHGLPPDIPDVEKALLESVHVWPADSEETYLVEPQRHDTSFQQHFLQPWSRPPPHV